MKIFSDNIISANKSAMTVETIQLFVVKHCSHIPSNKLGMPTDVAQDDENRFIKQVYQPTYGIVTLSHIYQMTFFKA